VSRLLDRSNLQSWRNLESGSRRSKVKLELHQSDKELATKRSSRTRFCNALFSINKLSKTRMSVIISERIVNCCRKMRHQH